MTSTWQRPQSARPPHTESTSTPSSRAACNNGVPMAKRPRLPEGVKTTSASLDTTAMSTLAPAAPGAFGCARSRWLAVLADPARAIRVMAHHHVRAHDRLQHVAVQRIGDGRGKPGGNCHRQKGAADAFALRQAKADVGC